MADAAAPPVDAVAAPEAAAAAPPADAPASAAADVAARLVAENAASGGDSGAGAAADADAAAPDAGDAGVKRKFDGEAGAGGDESGEPSSKKPATEGEAGATTEGEAAAGDGGDVIIECPHSTVGRLIGRGGETIKDLQERSQASIQIDQNLPEGVPRRVTISGNPQAVATAKKMITDIINQDPNAPAPTGEAAEGQDSKTVECPPAIVGRIIGRGGETIKALQMHCGAHISIDQNVPQDAPRQITVTGAPAAVERGLQLVNELITGGPSAAQQIMTQPPPGGASKVLECPGSVVGRVIGRGGESIKNLQARSGARIQIDQSTNPMKVTITGMQQAVDIATTMVMNIINGGSEAAYGPGGGFPGGGFPGGHPGMMGMGGHPGMMGGYGGYPPMGGGYPGMMGGHPGMMGGYGGGHPGMAAQDPYAAYHHQQQQGAQGGHQQQQQQPGAGGGAGSTGWGALQDAEGRTYYYNSQTGVSQWDKPEGL